MNIEVLVINLYINATLNSKKTLIIFLSKEKLNIYIFA